jgi:hypothetical protein
MSTQFSDNEPFMIRVMIIIAYAIIVLTFVYIYIVMLSMVFWNERMDIMMKVIYIVTLILISMMSYGLYIEPIKGGGVRRRRRL